MSAHMIRRKHPVQIVLHMVKTEGFASLFKGWVPAFVRLGPHTIVTFIVLERLKEWHAEWTQTVNTK